MINKKDISMDDFIILILMIYTYRFDAIQIGGINKFVLYTMYTLGRYVYVWEIIILFMPPITAICTKYSDFSRTKTSLHPPTHL